MVTTGPSNGSLLIHGGPPVDDEFIALFKRLAGGPGARIVYIPTAETDEVLFNSGLLNNGSFDFKGIPTRVLHTRSKTEADSDAFVSPLLAASGAFIDGGRQPRLAEAYLHTRTHQELTNLLARGGVIAGTSAGATIQGSFLGRGARFLLEVKERPLTTTRRSLVTM